MEGGLFFKEGQFHTAYRLTKGTDGGASQVSWLPLHKLTKARLEMSVRVYLMQPLATQEIEATLSHSKGAGSWVYPAHFDLNHAALFKIKIIAKQKHQ